MSHREPNDYDRELYDLMYAVPGWDDLDPEQADRERDAWFGPDDTLLDCTAAVRDMEKLMQPLPEPIATGAWVEINKTFSQKQAEAMQRQIDHVARFYRRKAV